MNTSGILLLNQEGKLRWNDIFIANNEALHIYDCLQRQLAWQEETIFVYGRLVKVPRLVCWYGDTAAEYTYSGVNHQPHPWTVLLKELKEKIEGVTGETFNSVLGNLYRDGHDSMGWHADKEKELGPEPFIASLSFGDSRYFILRHTKTKETIKLELTNGSLLLMSGELQKVWRHCVPKTKQVKTPRINLTFRRILSKAG